MQLFSLLLVTWLDEGRGSIKMGSIFVIVLCLFEHIIPNSISPELYVITKSTFANFK